MSSKKAENLYQEFKRYNSYKKAMEENGNIPMHPLDWKRTYEWDSRFKERYVIIEPDLERTYEFQFKSIFEKDMAEKDSTICRFERQTWEQVSEGVYEWRTAEIFNSKV
jgi:hypothetical protein